MLTCSDEILLHEMSTGKREAFTILYRRYWEELFLTAVKALRGKEEAADVVQDVFLSLWNRRNELNIQGSIGAYLHTSVRYKCIHYIEKNITRRDYLVQLSEMEVSHFTSNPEIDLQLKEIQQAVTRTVANMPPKMQEVYNLSRQQHLTYNQIADQMGISSETVKKHVQGALRLIRTNLTYHTFLVFMIGIYLPS